MAVGSTTLRMTGMYSGMDTDSLVKAMMQIEQTKVNKQSRSLTSMQWKQESVTSVSADLKSFMSDFTSVLGSKSMMKSSNYVKFNAKVTGKNTDAVTVTGSSSAYAQTLTIDKITRLATATKVSSAAGISKNTTAESPAYILGKDIAHMDFDTTKLSDLEGFEANADGNVVFSINDEKFTISGDTSISDFMSQINSSGAGVTIGYIDTNEAGRGFTLTSTATGKDAAIKITNSGGNLFGSKSIIGIDAGTVATGTSKKTGELAAGNSVALKDLEFAQALKFENGEIAFSINGEEFSFKETDTLQSMINKINSSDAGVTMVYSRLTDSISFESKAMGSESKLEIKNLKGNAFGSNSAFGIDNGSYKNGENALLSINGVEVEKDSNSFTLDGINYELNTITGDDEPITVKLEQDVSGAVDSIKEFINGYNTLISKLSELVSSRQSINEKGYIPLTEDEKAEMTDEQIEKWETIAKKGLLYNDSGIQSMLSSLRGALYDTIEGAGISMAELGLRTGDWEKGGQITLNEDMLTEALEKNPHQVMNAFMSISTSTDEATAYKENGILTRINTIMNGYIKGSGQTLLNTLETSIYNTQKRITSLEEKILEQEERLYAKYAALESAMSEMDSQSNWLSSMLGSTSK